MNYKDKFVGIKLYGFCNGFFGRDSYSNKIIIASGESWIVTKNEDEEVEFAEFGVDDSIEELLKDWMVEDEY